MFADADLDVLHRQHDPFLDGAAEDAAVMVGRAELRVGHIAMRVEMQNSQRAVFGMSCAQQRQRDRVIAADRDRESIRAVQPADGRLNRRIAVRGSRTARAAYLRSRRCDGGQMAVRRVQRCIR